MSLPHWAVQGTGCVCIDDAWTDVDTNLPTVAPSPIKGARYTIVFAKSVGSAGFVVVSGYGIAPDFWSVEAFRPLTAQERDTELFDKMLKGASEEKLRELELML